MVSIRILRAVLAIPRKVIAQKSGVSYREITRVERGDVKPSIETLQAIDGAIASVVAERAAGAIRRARA